MAPPSYVPPIAPTTPGGTGTPGDTGLSPQDKAATLLAQALQGQGVTWDFEKGQPYAPPASAIGGRAWKRIQNMPALYEQMMLARQASGQKPADYLAEIGSFQHAAPGYQQVSYGW